ncbi:unnamed protein product [Rotaria magnacalcarata]|uniref:VWFA domain-containing protein n=1 Tax=Rotaria magnacalcarata TaxID=392030 RepID=A0A816MW86_9BILA|nr:unnamed protein product [Rotaria magnacalcarata]CAF1505582.1 unnamed protein product [Rotaria magnacalcarata]CAF2010695.1 unnamed protein product [Rotaria magnacalcarata]CAF2037000.1 unnamed protein product [Rotaria magnacalcarata]CAF2200420.1 unnamed protein product [Rotaria magnacalcarata]
MATKANRYENPIDNHNQSIENSYEIFLLDTSTSMWYSDSFTGLFGKSRFQIAIQFLEQVFQQRWNSLTNQISFITFDKHPTEHFSFETIRQHHLEILEKLQPNGSQTCLFDALKFSLEKFEKLNEILNRSTRQSIYILTDGADNFNSSGNQKQYIKFIKEYSKKLNILGNIIQVGDRNLFYTKNLCQDINYQFHHFNSYNTQEFMNSYLLLSNIHSNNISTRESMHNFMSV